LFRFINKAIVSSHKLVNRTRRRNMEPTAAEGLVFKEEIHIPTTWGYLAGVV
jgi:hypothetical protein